MQMFDVLNVTTYKDNAGQEKKKFIHCGIVFLNQDKGSAMKLDVQNMSGDYLLLPKKDRKEQEQQQENQK